MTKAANFDRVARAYRWCEYAALGHMLQRMRCHWLSQIKQARQALMLGDGDGRFTEELLVVAPQLEATAVDTSAKMLELLRGRCSRFGERLTTLQISALDTPVPAGTDLLVTHFFLDCLMQDDMDVLANRMFAQTASGTLWVLSDFAVPQAGLLRPIAKAYIHALYLSFGVLTGLKVRSLPDPQTALAHAGFERIARHEAMCGVLYTEIWRHT